MRTIFVLMLSALGVCAQSWSMNDVAWMAQQKAASGTYLLHENYETPTTGYENAGWTQGGTATITPASTAVVLQGTQSLLIDCTGGKFGYTYHGFTSGGTTWIFFRFQTPASGQGNSLMRLYVTGITTKVMDIVYLSTGAIRVEDGDGAHTATTVATVSTSTTYLIWLRYTAGSGANAVLSVGFSTTTTEPTSGNNFASITTGDSTSNAGSIALFTDSVNVVYDTVRVATFDPGNNPP